MGSLDLYPEPDSQSGSGLAIRIRTSNQDPDSDPGGKNDPQKKKNKYIKFFEVLDVLICGLKASPILWMSFVDA